MRNRYPGECYRCQKWVAAGDGHFERLGGKWRVQHAACAIAFRGVPDEARKAQQARALQWRAKQTGPRGQRARKKLREQQDAVS